MAKKKTKKAKGKAMKGKKGMYMCVNCGWCVAKGGKHHGKKMVKC